MTLFKHIINSSPIGEITIIWRRKPRFQIEEIIISNPNKTSSQIAKEKYEKEGELAINKKSKRLNNLLKEIDNYFNEKKYKFSLEDLNLDKLKPFQRKVLETEFNSKKGTVNTYKDIAKAIGSPKAYRAVGTALAKNPFPIIIPCHRTIKADKTIGGFNGFAGGLESKKTLLELDGLLIQGKKVVRDSPIISLDKTSQTKLV
ncbi:methylated-DNA-[protein]-cysteine S-methyltransferase [Methanobrevibacter olleyae]|uniref:Methylated-DNA-[protein]-cysteine S-methyltransferase n=1 Tax=Methanobrevibacter olleyae TaxID=294671 RepID=A0A1I4G6F6_METOL|nr:methylated-DNA--[protein]-cysteine S-methyltransferase [Methanobrevibacter olleyae]SFL24691.1 methylated-DNA-[protein]-cysteine S-methyltransferase [Methanobrevibacter olleyae]